MNFGKINENKIANRITIILAFPVVIEYAIKYIPILKKWSDILSYLHFWPEMLFGISVLLFVGSKIYFRKTEKRQSFDNTQTQFRIQEAAVHDKSLTIELGRLREENERLKSKVERIPHCNNGENLVYFKDVAFVKPTDKRPLSDIDALIDKKIMGNNLPWEEEKKQYEAKEIYDGVFLYVKKQYEPNHFLCTTCFNQEKQVLTLVSTSNGWDMWKCQHCESKFYIRSGCY
jgi:hypothetical protein